MVHQVSIPASHLNYHKKLPIYYGEHQIKGEGLKDYIIN